MHKKWWGTLGGFGAGVINGLLGAGGGMVVVPLLSALGARGKKSHATALISAGRIAFQSGHSPNTILHATGNAIMTTAMTRLLAIPNRCTHVL